MAQTKVSLIKDGVIVVGHLHEQHGITTDNIGEGINNVYFTTDRVQDYLDNNGYVPGSETLTSISLSANTLSYVDENGDTTNLDLSLYLDDTNLARITSGTLNSGTGIATFTRDDATTFTIDFSAFLSDADDYVNSASFNTTDGVLTLTRLSGNTVTVDLDNRYSLSDHNHDSRYLRKDTNDTSSGNLTINNYLRIQNDLGNIAQIKLSESTVTDHVILEYDGTGSGLTNYFHMYSGQTGWATKGTSFNMQPQTGDVNIGGTNFGYKFRVDGTTYLSSTTTVDGTLYVGTNEVIHEGNIGNYTGSSNYLPSHDTRSVASTPETQDASEGIRFDFKQNSTNGLSDGGTYNGVMYWRKYGGGSDWTGGGAKEIAYTDNGNLWHRYGTNTTWGDWRKIWDNTNLVNVSQLNNDAGYLTSLGWNSNDNFTGTYPLVWKAGEVPYTASWLNVNGATDTLHTRHIDFSGYRLLKDSNSASDTVNIKAANGQYMRMMQDQSGFGIADSEWTHTLHLSNLGPSNGNRAEIYQNSSKDIYLGNTANKSPIKMFHSLSMGIPGNGSNAHGRFISLEGNTDASGEGSGRIFFTEHNSTTTSMDNYGMSIGYRGGATTITGASGNSWTGLSQIGNGQWGMWGHDNNATGSLIMYGDRGATFVDFAGNNVQGISNLTISGTLYMGTTIQMANNDGFVYDDGSNIMYVRTDGANHKLWHQGNDGSGSGLDADLLDGNHGSYFDHRRYTDSNNYLGGYYVSGGTEKPNSSVFGPGKLKIAMLRGGSNNLGFGGTWNDVLWMSTYTGSDVKRSTALVSSKYDNTSLWIAKQSYDSSSWGTGYLMWNSGNLDYEEGTWSMVWGYGVSGTPYTAAASSFGGMSQTCKYVKIGRLVHCSFYFRCTSFPWGAGGTGSPAWIAEAGLPYAMESQAQGTGSFECFPGFSSSRTTPNEVTGALIPWRYGTSGRGLAPVGNREYYGNLGAIDTDAFAIGPGGDFTIEGAFTYYTSS